MADIVTLGLALDSKQVLTARDRSVRALESIRRSSKQTATGLQALTKSFGRLAGAFASVIAFQVARSVLRDIAKAFKDGEQSAAKLNAVLKATDQAAGRTARSIDRLGQAMADTTLFNDDEIRNTAAVLATFRNIQGKVFDEALASILDMSQVLDQDLKTSAISLGKALNDPIAGISALSRVGVTFTEQQKEMIRTMAGAGDIAGAQAVILKELSMEFGGGAAGANVGLFASINQTGKAWADFLEVLGRSAFVASTVGRAFDALKGFLESITPTTDDLDFVTIELSKVNDELERLESRGLKPQRVLDQIEALREEAANLNNVRNQIRRQRAAEEAAAEASADEQRAEMRRQQEVADVRAAQLKRMQDDANEFNTAEKARAAAWQRSWGRAIENTQDSFARFFSDLLTKGVTDFADFANRILQIWVDVAAQIAATKLFEAFISTAAGASLVKPGIPNLQDVPTGLPKVAAATGQANAVIVQQTVSFNVAAMDAQSFDGYVQQNSGSIARALQIEAQNAGGLARMIEVQ